MKKQSLIHVHGLLAVADSHLEDQGVDVEHDAYDSVNVGPNAIHKSKKQHRKAVLAYARDVARAVGGE